MLLKQEVTATIEAHMTAKDIKWNVRQCRDKFKNVLKKYRSKKRSQRVHTGNGEAPGEEHDLEMSRIVASSDPAINPPILSDDSIEHPAFGVSAEFLKRKKQKTDNSDLTKTLQKYVAAKFDKLSVDSQEAMILKKKLKLKAIQFVEGKSEEEFKRLGKLSENVLESS